MKNLLLITGLFTALFLMAGNSFAQPYYYNSGDPANTANWGNLPGGGGTHPPDFFRPTEYIIESGKNAIVVNPTWVIGATNTVLRINPGGTLTANFAVIIGPAGTFIIDSAGTYIHNNTEVPTFTIFQGEENFHRKSNFRVDNWVSLSIGLTYALSPNSNGYFFGNLEINWESCNGDWAQGLVAPTLMCENDFRVTSTGSGIFIFGRSPDGIMITVIVGSYIQTGGEVDLALGSTYTNTYIVTLNIIYKFEKTGGVLDANGGTSFGMIGFIGGNFVALNDTTYQTFYNAGTTRRIRFSISDGSGLKLLSSLPLTTNNSRCGLVVGFSSVLDCGIHQVSGMGPLILQNFAKIKMASPFGFKTGTSGNITTTGQKTFGANDTLEYNGTSPQVLGDSLANPFPAILKINNPAGVSLSKTTRFTSFIKFISGRLNTENFDLIIPRYSHYTQLPPSGVSRNSFINTNGTGYVKFYASATGVYMVPIGNGTYNSLVYFEFFSVTPDTFSVRAIDGFITMPGDTSYLAKKTWYVKENTPGGNDVSAVFCFDTSNTGENFHILTNSYIGKFNQISQEYEPFNGGVFTLPINGVIGAGNNVHQTSFNEQNYFIAGDHEGVYNSYNYISGDPTSPSNWKRYADGSGASAPSFVTPAYFYIGQDKNAVFDSPITFFNQTILRLKGNGIMTANQSVTSLGRFEIRDSATYTHNNTGIAAGTIFAGTEWFDPNSTYNVTMWSDTAHKLFTGLPLNIGNLTVNFNNLPSPIGVGKWKNPGAYYIMGTFKYIRSSGYNMGIVPNPDNFNEVTIGKHLQIGDSVNYPDENPVLDIAAGTTRPLGQASMNLDLRGDLDIQRGGLISQEFPNLARGRILFAGNRKHTFYCHDPFFYSTYNLGNANFPNTIYPRDTLVLKSDMYRSQQAAFLFTDIWEVQGVLDMDTHSVRSLSLRIKPGAKVVTKKRSGLMLDMSSVQSANFEIGSTLEFAGSGPQDFMSPGSYEVKNISNLIINNQNNVTMNVDSISIIDTLTLRSGKLITSSPNYITMSGTSKFRTLNNISFIDGPLKVITSSAMEHTIPIGKGNISRSVKIFPAAGDPTEWFVEYFNSGQTYGSALDPALMSISNNEYFTIERSGASNAYVALHWGPTSGVNNPANTRVAKWDGAMWTNTGYLVHEGTNDSGYVYSSMVSSFSPFVLASIDVQPLPVELASFTAIMERTNVNLSWTTTNEINNSGFDIERKLITDSTWSKVGFVQGSGNTTQTKNYKYEDRNLITGKYNYRLKQIDYNGNFNFFNLQNEINVGIPNEFALSQNYPNPFNPTTKINFEVPKDSKVSIQIFDMTGRLVATLLNNQDHSAGYYTVQFNASQFASGTYFYRFIAGDFVQTKKMQLIK